MITFLSRCMLSTTMIHMERGTRQMVVSLTRFCPHTLDSVFTKILLFPLSGSASCISGSGVARGGNRLIWSEIGWVELHECTAGRGEGMPGEELKMGTGGVGCFGLSRGPRSFKLWNKGIERNCTWNLTCWCPSIVRRERFLIFP